MRCHGSTGGASGGGPGADQKHKFGESSWGTTGPSSAQPRAALGNDRADVSQDIMRSVLFILMYLIPQQP